MSKPCSPAVKPSTPGGKPAQVGILRQQRRGDGAEDSALLRRIEDGERRHLDRTFDEMDVDNDGLVSTSEFTRFLSRNPRGWPLGDMLDGQPAELRAQMIEFWFRKIDLMSEGYISKDELAAFFAAMKVTTFRDAFTADFLINLFDVDLDRKLSRVEMKRMLRVMIGHEPREEVVQRLCGRTGYVSRDELIELLHEVKGSVANLEKSRAATVGGSTLDYVVVAATTAAVIGIAAIVYQRFVA
jgi:Ca2+-binding EF-hand superfamily protein